MQRQLTKARRPRPSLSACPMLQQHRASAKHLGLVLVLRRRLHDQSAPWCGRDSRGWLRRGGQSQASSLPSRPPANISTWPQQYRLSEKESNHVVPLLQSLRDACALCCMRDGRVWLLCNGRNRNPSRFLPSLACTRRQGRLQQLPRLQKRPQNDRTLLQNVHGVSAALTHDGRHGRKWLLR